ncbi:MAG: DUF4178 domain-containing protein [Acutalibacteraceae bacterium]|jgi:hypothetical protein|nr:DUF4178 domain-containing protein [Acutalibacteraceae bacterium]
MSLLELKYKQEILIEKVKYEVLSITRFREKSSYWIEYSLRRLDDYKIFYLNVELSSKAILYEILENTRIDLNMNISFQGNSYELYEKGTGVAEFCYGMTDIRLYEEVSYYEYQSRRDKKIFLSVEKWYDETEVSLGRLLKPSAIRY